MEATVETIGRNPKAGTKAEAMGMTYWLAPLHIFLFLIYLSYIALVHMSRDKTSESVLVSATSTIKKIFHSHVHRVMCQREFLSSDSLFPGMSRCVSS